MIRTFIAFDTPQIVKEQIIQLQNELKKCNADVRWEANDKLHVTIKFLGDVLENVLPSVQKEVEKIIQQFSPFNIEFSSLGCFPNWSGPRILWVGCSEVPEVLSRMKKEFDSSLAMLGFEKENRKYFPHLTLGRVKGNRRVASK